MRSRVHLAVAVALAVLTAACRVGANDEPVELSGSIPFGLLETTTSTSSSVPEQVTKEVTVYFLDPAEGERLVAVPRDVDVAADVQAVLRNLFSVRPDGSERPLETGLTSSIPESATLLSAVFVPDSSRLIVDVRGLFGNEGIQGIDLRNALAQIVWTATDSPSVTEVVFRNSGVEVQALVDNGEVADGPVNRSDYRSV